jgi:hypothetical protein
MIKRTAPWLAWLVVAILAARFLLFVAANATRPSDGFVAYYTAARLLREGEPVSRFYDNAWFRAQVARFEPGASDIYNVNPPTTALLLLPLAGLAYEPARAIWEVTNVLVLAASLGLLFWRLELRGFAGLAMLGLVFVYQPLFANFQHAQAYVLLFGLLVLAWYGYRRERPVLFGVALGFMLILKTAAILLWLLPLVQRKWRALAVGIGVALAVVLASLPWVGLDAWRTYLPLMMSLPSHPEIAVTAYQTLPSLFRHLFIYDPQWNPAPLWSAPALGQVLPWLGLVAMLAVSVYAAIRGGDPDLAFVLFVIASVVLSPVSIDYHYTLLLLPIAILVAWARRQASAWPWILIGAGALLIAANLPYLSPRVAAGAMALLAYPKLYGACLLWALACWASLRARSPALAHRFVTASAPAAV